VWRGFTAIPWHLELPLSLCSANTVVGGFVQAVCIKPEQWKAELHNYKKIISGVLLQLLNFGLKKHLISVLDILHFHVHIQN
jgi:hypothetical protein